MPKSQPSAALRLSRLNAIIIAASSGYPDNMVAQFHWNPTTGRAEANPDSGDTLALFVAREASEVARDEPTFELMQSEAERAIRTAADELLSVADAIASAKAPTS